MLCYFGLFQLISTKLASSLLSLSGRFSLFYFRSANSFFFLVIVLSYLKTIVSDLQAVADISIWQHVLEHGKLEERSAIISKFTGQIVRMSQQKFASNVVEKCLMFASSEERQLLINEMLGSTDENEPLQVQITLCSNIISNVFDYENLNIPLRHLYYISIFKFGGVAEVAKYHECSKNTQPKQLKPIQSNLFLQVFLLVLDLDWISIPRI